MAVQIKVKKGVPRTMGENDNPSFDEWFSRVGKVLSAYSGVSVGDLPDMDYRKMYDRRLRPIHAANKALKNAQDD